MPAEQSLRALNGKYSKINVRCAILPKPLPYLTACLRLSLVLSEIKKKKKKHSSGTTEHIPFFQLFWLRAICFNDELILRVHSAALPAWAVMPFAHVRSGPRSNLSLITAGEAKSSNGTSPCSAELHFYHWVPLSLIRCFSPCLSCFAVCLWSFSLSCLILLPPHLLSIVISCPPPTPTLPHLFLDLCLSLSCWSLSASLHSFSTLLGGGTRRVQLVGSFRLVLLSLLRIREGPVYQ